MSTERMDPNVVSFQGEDGLKTEKGTKPIQELIRWEETTPLVVRVERKAEVLPVDVELRLLSERVEDIKAIFIRACPQFLVLFENLQYHGKTKGLLEDILRLVLSVVKLFPDETLAIGDLNLLTAPDQKRG